MQLDRRSVSAGYAAGRASAQVEAEQLRSEVAALREELAKATEELRLLAAWRAAVVECAAA
jgi:hypothetical protein